MHSLTLYQYWRSSCSWRLRWALAYKSIPYESIPINLLQGQQLSSEYLKINPSGSVPALVIDGQSFSQSLALIEWIEESYPNPPLLPSSPIERLKVRELTHIIALDTQPIQNLRVLKRYSDDPNNQKEWAKHWIEKGLNAFEKRLEVMGSEDFCVGKSLTMADLALIPQCYNAERFGVDLKETPRCLSIYQFQKATPACENAAPEKFQ